MDEDGVVKQKRFNTALFKQSGLLDQAVAVLQRAISANPDDAKALLRLGDIHRQKGDLSAALEAYERLCAIAPDNAAAAWLTAVLKGDNLPSVAPPGRCPAPFLRLKGFLTRTEQKRLFRAVSAAGRERFHPAGVGGKEGNTEGVVDRNTRDAIVADGETRREVGPWFKPKLRDILPSAWARLGLEAIDQCRIEMDITAHLSDGHYKPHKDNGRGRYRNRRLSYVYYFHREPKRFSGGDLHLYDTAVEAGEEESKGVASYFRIEPLHNSLILFPSHCLHEITTVECDTDDFMSGRFTVNGWVRPRSEGSADAPNG